MFRAAQSRVARSALGSPGLWDDAGRASEGQGCGPGREAHGHVLPWGGLFMGSWSSSQWALGPPARRARLCAPCGQLLRCSCEGGTLAPRSLGASCLVSGPKQDRLVRGALGRWPCSPLPCLGPWCCWTIWLMAALSPPFPAFWSASYSSTNGPSVAREKRLRRLAGALTCPERCLLKLLFSSFGQGPCAELFPVGVPGCLQSISPHRRLETGKKASLWELTLIPRPHSRTGCVPLWTQINKLESF